MVEDFDAAPGIGFGAAWLRDHPFKVGDKVSVILTAEGPIRAGLAPDFAEVQALMKAGIKSRD